MKGGENEMQSFANIQLRLINERHAEDFRLAAISRRHETPRPSIRRAIGTRIVRFGTRLAGEPTYGLARSR
jgi:Trk K+ transport system NAD-binding subunit